MFFNDYLPYWEMGACNAIIDRNDAYCAAKEDEIYAVYLPEGGTAMLRLPKERSYSIAWFDPLMDGPLQEGSVKTVEGNDQVDLGLTPKSPGKDWVVLIQKTE